MGIDNFVGNEVGQPSGCPQDEDHGWSSSNPRGSGFETPIKVATTTRWRRLERVMGIEPTLVAWEATVLPLNYTRTGRDSSVIAAA